LVVEKTTEVHGLSVILSGSYETFPSCSRSVIVSGSLATIPSSRNTYALFPQWAIDLHTYSLCGDNNRAIFGSCLASTGKHLEIRLGFTEPANPGLPFSASIWKLDFYYQTVSSDSSTFLKIQTEPASNSSGSGSWASAVSGETVFQLVGGHATVAVALQPYVADIEADSGLTRFAGDTIVYAEGLDEQSSAMLRCTSPPVHRNPAILNLGLRLGKKNAFDFLARHNS
jgi:hypothetical protein